MEAPIEGILFDGHKVHLHPQSTRVGGSWQGPQIDGFPGAWDGAVLRYFSERLSEYEAPRILDIGANTGSFALLGTIHPQMEGFAFEPVPSTFDLLRANIEFNNLQDRMHPVPVALSNYLGKTTIKLPTSGVESGLACIGTPHRFTRWREIEVDVLTLDHFAGRHRIESVDLVKIDTEGCELLVLQGGEAFLQSCRPGILFEYHAPNTRQFDYEPEAITDLLRSWGYSAFTPMGGEDLFAHRPTAPVVVDLGAAGATPGEQFVFDRPGSLAINDARMQHLGSLGLELTGKRVLEVGAGIGLLTGFFEERNCRILSTEARPENIEEFNRRYPHREVRQADLEQPGSHDSFGRFDVVFCYGTLYHLDNPALALEDLARVCDGYLLLETCVASMDNGKVNLVGEAAGENDQAKSGTGCRPGRDWVMNELKKYFPYVYVSATQPAHHDFPSTWPDTRRRHNSRAVFVAARTEINLPTLLDVLPLSQPVYLNGRNHKVEHHEGTTPGLPAFESWIKTISGNTRQLYYRDQTPATLSYLFDLARSYRPTRIVELGTLSGLSLRTWVAATSDLDTRITAIDLSFRSLQASRRSLPLDLSRVFLLEKNILEVDFTALWDPEDRVILFVDAHDLDKVPIMDRVLQQALPSLPAGSRIVVDDVWYSEQILDKNTIPRFFHEIILEAIDPIQCFDGWYASYHRGGSFFGFREVVPLLTWINEHGCKLEFDKNGKTVYFEVGSSPERAVEPAKKTSWGQVPYNPIEYHFGSKNIPKAQAQARKWFGEAVAHYAGVRIQESLEALSKTSSVSRRPERFNLLKAVCLVRSGRFKDAMEWLRKDLEQSEPNPFSARLLKDVEQYVDRNRPTLSTNAITLFAIPKAFKGHIGVIQRNAIQSWQKITPEPEIILFGNDEGTAEVAAEFGLRHVTEVVRSEAGTPLVNDIFRQARALAANEIICYINADIILQRDFWPAIQSIRRQSPSFLVVGQRWDTDITEPIDFSRPDWESVIRAEVEQTGVLHSPTGLDYFAFSGFPWPSIPPFAIGRYVWDSWLLATAIRHCPLVVDATDQIRAVHQNHNYDHTGFKHADLLGSPEVQTNRALAGGSYAASGITTMAVPWMLKDLRLIRRPFVRKHFKSPEFGELAATLILGAVRMAECGYYERALERLDDAARISYSVPGLHYARACILNELGHPAEAEREIEIEKRVNPDLETTAAYLERPPIQNETLKKTPFVSMVEDVSRALAGKDWKTAGILARICTESYPDESYAWVLQAKACRLQKQMQPALESITVALHGEESPDALYELLQISRVNGQDEESRQIVHHLEERFPDWLEKNEGPVALSI